MARFLVRALVVLCFGFGCVKPVAAETALKGALIVSPSELSLSSRWLASLAKDKPVNLEQTIYVGVEIQTAIYKISGATVVPLNGFLNLKYKTATVGTRPFFGAGFGLATAFTFQSGTDWNPDLAVHFLGGVDVGKFTFELQIERSFVTGLPFQYIILGGLVF